MANVHNLILRGLNSIYLQADKLSDPADIADFMLYTKAWNDTVHHHHWTEETFFFPRIEELAIAAGLGAGIMSRNKEQHREFDAALHDLKTYVEEGIAKTRAFDAKEFLGLVERLAPVLRQHLHDEIDTLIGLEKCDGKGVKKALQAAADEGAKTADPVSVLAQPLLFYMTTSCCFGESACLKEYTANFYDIELRPPPRLWLHRQDIPRQRIVPACPILRAVPQRILVRRQESRSLAFQPQQRLGTAAAVGFSVVLDSQLHVLVGVVSCYGVEVDILMLAHKRI